MTGLVCAWLFALSGTCSQELAAAVADGVEKADPLWADDPSKVKTAALVVAVAWRESAFDQKAHSPTDDWCVLQIHGRKDLAENLAGCVRVGIEALRWSLRTCAAHPVAPYIAGAMGCKSERAQRMSNDRMRLAAMLVRGGAK